MEQAISIFVIQINTNVFIVNTPSLTQRFESNRHPLISAKSQKKSYPAVTYQVHVLRGTFASVLVSGFQNFLVRWGGKRTFLRDWASTSISSLRNSFRIEFRWNSIPQLQT